MIEDNIKFPIYIKDGLYNHKLLSPFACQTVQRKTEGLIQFGVYFSDLIHIKHTVYKKYLAGKYEKSTEQEFAYARINVQNEMTRTLSKFKP